MRPHSHQESRWIWFFETCRKSLVSLMLHATHKTLSNKWKSHFLHCDTIFTFSLLSNFHRACRTDRIIVCILERAEWVWTLIELYGWNNRLHALGRLRRRYRGSQRITKTRCPFRRLSDIFTAPFISHPNLLNTTHGMQYKLWNSRICLHTLIP